MKFGFEPWLKNSLKKCPFFGSLFLDKQKNEQENYKESTNLYNLVI
jgi:hypothetical protein